MKIDGRCHCGYITYEAEIDPEKVMICHCADCQTLSGSAFRTVVFTREDTFNLLSGKLKTYIKTGESGTKRPQSFCPECGTPIHSSTLGDGQKVHVILVRTQMCGRMTAPGHTRRSGHFATKRARRRQGNPEGTAQAATSGCSRSGEISLVGVIAAGRHRAPKAKAFVDVLSERLGSVPWRTGSGANQGRKPRRRPIQHRDPMNTAP